MPVTLKDLAGTLNLSITTVSRALAGYDDVAETTRQRVIAAAREMGYVANRTARQLRRQRSDTIGLVLPTVGPRFSDPFFAEFIAGVGDGVVDTDIDLLVSVAPPGAAEQEVFRRLVQSRRVDGLILVRMRKDDWRVHYLMEAGFPFVTFGRSQATQDFPHIGVDGHAGMYELVNHLVEHGYRRIAFVSAPDGLTLQAERMSGYEAGLAAHRLPLDEGLVVAAELTRASGYEAGGALLALDDPPAAIIGVNDLTALGVMRAVQERGLVIGKDLAVAGFDGTDAAEHAHPPLTTLYQPVYEIGQRVSQMLLALIAGETVGPPWPLLTPELIVRASTTG